MVQSLTSRARKTSYAVYVALALALIVLWAGPSTIRSRASVPTASLTLACYLVLIVLSFLEHQRSVRPSLILNSYLSISLLFDTARARTLWLQGYNHNIAIVFTAAVAIKSMILLLECIEKRQILRGDYRAYPSEATAGIYSQSFFWWLNVLFRTGFSKTLHLDDLFTLDKHLISAYLQHLLDSAWNKG